MKIKFKNILITGGAGFIGSNFIIYLQKNYPDLNIVNLDNLTYASDLNFLDDKVSKNNYTFTKGDICDESLVENIFIKHKIDGVINFAAETHVDNSIANPDSFFRTNIYGVYTLLKVCKRNWMDKPFKFKKGFEHCRFHQISTDEIYGSITKGSFDENSTLNPSSPYSASKASADMLVNSFKTTYGLSTSISISSNNYGENQNIEKFIPKVINSLINAKPIPVYGNGLNVRDWIHVNDNCTAIFKIFTQAQSGSKYNVAAKNELSNLDVINLISSILDEKQIGSKKISFVQDRFGHDFRYSISVDKIKQDLNWINKFEFRPSIEIIIEKIKNI